MKDYGFPGFYCGDEKKHVTEMFFQKIKNIVCRPTWINETLLEFERYLYLQANVGIHLKPCEESLLGIYVSMFKKLNIMGEDRSVDDLRSASIYIDVFGHSLPYIWTKEIHDLSSEVNRPEFIGGSFI